MTLKWYQSAKKWREKREYTTQDWKEYIKWIDIWTIILVVGYLLFGFYLGMIYANL